MNEIEKILKAIDNLNQELFDNHREEYARFNIRCNDAYWIVYFDEIPICNSENDERNFDNDANEYEDIKIHIKRKFNEYVDMLVALRFKRVPKWKGDDYE